MREHSELQDMLLEGLDDDEQRDLKQTLRRAHTAQLDRVQHPPPRRRRDESDLLQPLDPVKEIDHL